MPITESRPAPKQVMQLTKDWAAHASVVMQIVRGIGAKRILELGTDVGDSTRILACALEDIGGHLWSVDIQDPKWPAGVPVPANVTFVKGDAMKFYSEDMLDLLLIDDDHTYPHVLNELRRFGPCVRQGGKILLHDIANPQHGPAVLKSALEWCRELSLPLTIMPEGHGLGVIDVVRPIASNPQ